MNEKKEKRFGDPKLTKISRHGAVVWWRRTPTNHCLRNGATRRSIVHDRTSDRSNRAHPGVPPLRVVLHRGELSPLRERSEDRGFSVKITRTRN